MRKWQFFPILFIAALQSLFGQSQDTHLAEVGSASLLARSAFAHGYRHGYEEGYHLGNIDVSMGRQPQIKRKAHEINMAYSPQFGARDSFEGGFQAGLQAGYHDGFAGTQFRAVDSNRLLADHLEEGSSPGDPSGDFDHGLGSGYRDGFAQGQSSPSLPATLDFLSVSCTSSRPGIFCEGYRRGFVLGRVDALILRREYILEAHK